MDRERAEDISIDAVSSYLNTSSLIQPKLTKADRNISWDGELLLRSSDEHRIDNFIGHISVQVKSKQSFKMDKTAKYSKFELAHIRNYYEDGGVALFLVIINENDNVNKIYYRFLCAIELNKMIVKYSSQKTMTVEFFEAPNDVNIIYNKLLILLDEKKRQTGRKIIHNKEIGSVPNLLIPIAVNTNDPVDYLLKNAVSVYGRFDTNDQLFPIDKISIEYAEIEYNKAIGIDEKVYYSNCKLIRKRDPKESIIIEFGRRICVNYDQNKITYIPVGSIYNCIHDIGFLLDVMSQGVLYIGENKYTFSKKPETEISKTAFARMFKYYNDIANALSYYGVRIDSVISKFTENDEIVLNLLLSKYKCIESKYIANCSGLCTAKIAGQSFALFVYKNNIGEVKIENFYSDIEKRVKFEVFNEKTNEHFSISPYVLLDCKTILGSLNFNSDIVRESIKETTINESTEHHIVLLLLEIIHAYDNSNNIDLYNLAFDTASYLYDANRKNDYNYVNLIQVIRRKNDLTNEQQKTLFGLFEEHVDDLKLKMAIAILLENKFDYLANRSLLSEEEKDKFDKFPICKLIPNNWLP